MPIKRTYSLAFDFPLQFAQLKKSGLCAFRTDESPFRYAYPGLYGYRIGAINVSMQKTSAIPQVKGLLKNDGFSIISCMNGETHISMRYSDVLPLSEFGYSHDLEMLSLSDEVLLAFEGSGIETTWTLELPALANLNGFKDILDIIITFYLRANYSDELYKKHKSEMPKELQRSVLLSARKHQAKVLADLQGNASSVILRYDMKAIGLPQKESNREIKNMMLFLPGRELGKVKAKLQSTLIPTGLAFDFDKRYTVSNAGRLSSSATPSPLNIFTNQKVEQIFELIINKNDNPDVDFSKIEDVVLGIDYRAEYEL